MRAFHFTRLRCILPRIEWRIKVIQYSFQCVFSASNLLKSKRPDRISVGPITSDKDLSRMFIGFAVLFPSVHGFHSSVPRWNLGSTWCTHQRWRKRWNCQSICRLRQTTYKLSTDYHRGEYNPLLDEFPTVSETVKAIKLLSSGKAPGSGAIPPEIYKAGGPPVAEKLTVISHYVEKRSHPSRIQECNNYPPIQKERESSSLWQSSRHLFIVNCWEDPC